MDAGIFFMKAGVSSLMIFIISTAFAKFLDLVGEHSALTIKATLIVVAISFWVTLLSFACGLLALVWK